MGGPSSTSTGTMRSRTVSGSRSRPANTIAYRARRSGSMPCGRGPSRPSTSVRPSAPAGLATTATTKERVASKDRSGGQPPGQPVGAARGPRQRLGLVSGLVRRLCTRASHRPSRSCHGRDACSSWRQLEQRCGAPALRVPLFPRPRLLQPQHRFPACPGPLANPSSTIRAHFPHNPLFFGYRRGQDRPYKRLRSLAKIT